MVIPLFCYLSWGLARVMHAWDRGQLPILHDPTTPKQVEPYLFYRLIAESASRGAIHCTILGECSRLWALLRRLFPGPAPQVLWNARHHDPRAEEQSSF